MPAPPEKPVQPSKPEFKPVDALYGLGCLGILVYVVFGVLNFVSGPGRSEWMDPPVRAPKTADEKAIRTELESLTHSAAFTTTRDRAKETDPLTRLGPEPRPGVSLFTFCNGTDGERVVLLDGVEIFKLEVKAQSSVTVELKSGAYDFMVHGTWGKPGGSEEGVVVPTYRRVRFDSTCHVVMIAAGASGGDCSAAHRPPIRTVE